MEDNEEIKTFKPPKLDSLEKLYVRAYLSKLSHSYAHSVVSPGIKHPKEDNPFSRRHNVQFYISLALQEKMEAMELTPEKIIANLYKEAIREGRDASHSARIQALNILGKHLGLFTEKKEVEQFTFNIVNYSNEKLKVEEEKLEAEGELVEDISPQFEIISYSTETIEDSND